MFTRTRRQDGGPRRIGCAKRLAYGLIAAALLFGSAEIVLRALRLPHDKYLGKRFHFPTEDLYRTALQHDAKRFWRLAPNYDGPWEVDMSRDSPGGNSSPASDAVPNSNAAADAYFRTVTWEVNEEGFRGRARDPRKRTILFLGSSVTFGWGVRADDCFVGLVRQRLVEHGYGDWDVINAGVPGYTSHQCLRYLEELQDKIRPELVIVDCGINDGIWAPGLSDRDIMAVENRGWVKGSIETSNLLFVLASMIHGKTKETNEASTVEFRPRDRFYYTRMYVPGKARVSEADFKRNVVSIEEGVRRINARVFFIFPGLHNEYGRGNLVKAVRFSHRNEIEILAAMNARPGADNGEYFLPRDEAHLSLKGHRFFADLIWEHAVQPAVGLDPDKPPPP